MRGSSCVHVRCTEPTDVTQSMVRSTTQAARHHGGAPGGKIPEHEPGAVPRQATVKSMAGKLAVAAIAGLMRPVAAPGQRRKGLPLSNSTLLRHYSTRYTLSFERILSEWPDESFVFVHIIACPPCSEASIFLGRATVCSHDTQCLCIHNGMTLSTS